MNFKNPYRPGAGHLPPYLAGRNNEQEQFRQLLQQQPILKNLVVTGLRGVGKTVLLETLQPIANDNHWFWAGADLSEDLNSSQEKLCNRIITDVSKLSSSFDIPDEYNYSIGFKTQSRKLDYSKLIMIFEETAGLYIDKLKRVLEVVWHTVKSQINGIVLAYDEAQSLCNNTAKKEYSLSLLLETIQYLQKKEMPFLLILSGLPNLHSNLIEARTYTERMFQIITLDKLTNAECRQAILNPMQQYTNNDIVFDEAGINEIIKSSNGYPYFIQFFCKEAFDMGVQKIKLGIENPVILTQDITAKLDVDFYSGRWMCVTEKQKELLSIIADIPTIESGFSHKDIAAQLAKNPDNQPIKQAYVVNMLLKLTEAGIVYKASRGKYMFAIPMFADFVKRQST
jgi:type II secretory pathway predicted ATPase ExeA